MPAIFVIFDEIKPYARKGKSIVPTLWIAHGDHINEEVISNCINKKIQLPDDTVVAVKVIQSYAYSQQTNSLYINAVKNILEEKDTNNSGK